MAPRTLTPASLVAAVLGVRAVSATAPVPLNVRNTLLPSGCFSITGSAVCCDSVDARNDNRYSGQRCVPAASGGRFSSGNVCEPQCWVEGTCRGFQGSFGRPSGYFDATGVEYRQFSGECQTPDGRNDNGAGTVTTISRAGLRRSECNAECNNNPACGAWEFSSFRQGLANFVVVGVCEVHTGPIIAGTGERVSRTCYVRDDRALSGECR